MVVSNRNCNEPRRHCDSTVCIRSSEVLQVCSSRSMPSQSFHIVVTSSSIVVVLLIVVIPRIFIRRKRTSTGGVSAIERSIVTIVFIVGIIGRQQRRVGVIQRAFGRGGGGGGELPGTITTSKGTTIAASMEVPDHRKVGIVSKTGRIRIVVGFHPRFGRQHTRGTTSTAINATLLWLYRPTR